MGPLATLSLLTTPPLAALLALAWLAPATRSPWFDTLAVALAALTVGLGAGLLARRERRLREALAAAERQQQAQATALAAARAEVTRASAARRAFLATVGHELRTPMTTIIGMTRLALNSELSLRQREWLHRADRAAHQLQGQLEDILDYVRAESGAMPLHQQAFRLDAVLAAVLARARAGLSGKDLQLRLVRDPAIPAVLVGDDQRLAQVLHALADNAVKFTEAGEVVVAARLLRQDADGVEIDCEVRNSGNPEALGGPDSHTLFDAFTQADDSLSRRHGGAGLGLGLCRQLVARMDGRLLAHGLPGFGTRVQVQLRFGLAPSAADLTAATRTAANPTPPPPAAASDDAAPAAGLDLGPARRRCGSEARLRRLLRRFVADQVGFIEAYRTLYADGDRTGATRLAQQLTRAAAGLGARALAANASRLALMRRDGDDPTALLELVGDELAAVIGTLTEALNQPALRLGATTAAPTATPAQAGAQDTAAALDELAALLAEFDAAAINTFAGLRPLLAGHGPAEVLAALERDINGFDFSRALPRVFEFARAAGIDLTAAALASTPAGCAAGQRLH